MITAQGLAVNQSSGGEKNCVVYNLFCIFIIISFVVVLVVVVFPLLPY